VPTASERVPEMSMTYGPMPDALDVDMLRRFAKEFIA
jgi:hypothetical protein